MRLTGSILPPYRTLVRQRGPPPLSAATKPLAPFCHDIRVRKTTMPNAAPHPIVSAARFRRLNTLESTIFPTLVAFRGKRNLPNAPMQPPIIRAAPKNRLRPAYTRAVHLAQTPYPLQSKLTLSNS